jgi:hypothetical protein
MYPPAAGSAGTGVGVVAIAGVPVKTEVVAQATERAGRVNFM